MIDFSNWKGNGFFGKWETDKYGLPSYVFSPEKEKTNYTPETTESAIKHFPWHQIGNQRITATVHTDGFLQLYNSDRGLCCITPYQPLLNLYGGGLGVLKFANKKLIFLRRSFIPDENCTEVRFGLGYGKFSFFIEGVNIELIHWIPFGDMPIILSDVNISSKKENCTLEKFSLLFSVGYWFIDFDPICSGRRRIRYAPMGPAGMFLSFLSKNILYPFRLNTDYRRARDVCSFQYFIEKKNSELIYVSPRKNKVHFFDEEKSTSKQINPLTFFSKVCGEKCETQIFDSRKVFDRSGSLQDNVVEKYLRFDKLFSHPVVVMHSIDVKNKSKNHFRFIWGYGNQNKINELLDKISEESLDFNISLRKKKTCTFSLPKIPWVEREWIWHSDYLQSSAMYDSYFDSHTVRQGSAYYYIQGTDGAPRDHSLFVVPLCYLNPSLAKEILITTLRMTYKDGRIPYAIYGYGKVSGFGVHDSPSDLPLFFLWAVTEYIFATRDFNFLDENYLYYPRTNKISRTVIEQIYQTCEYIMNNIGTGPNGLLRVGTGDWNDPLHLHMKDRQSFKNKGESVYSTGMAIYVLPRIVNLLSVYDREKTEKLKIFIQNLRKALKEQWNGKWLYRAWDGKGNPLGKKHLYLEHHGWALITDILSDEQKKKIIDSVYRHLDKPSKIGAMILWPPKKLKMNILPKGWDTNGGIWAAANLLLAWGYGNSRRDFAKECLLKNTLCAHAENYPHIWYGIWSGPDSYNAHYAKNPGETFYHITPMADFPVMNANAHSNPITSAIKLCGIEPTLSGFHISPLLPDEEFFLDTPLLSIKRCKNSISFCYRPIVTSGNIEFSVDDSICKKSNIIVLSNDKEIVFNRDMNSKISFEISFANNKEFSWSIERN